MTLEVVSATIQDPAIKKVIEKMESFFLPKIIGFTYLCLTRPIYSDFGMKGEKVIRKGLRNFGKFRGARLKKWHVAENIPLNVESLFRFWDISSVRGCGAVNPEMILSPNYVTFKTDKCPIHEVCKNEDYEHWGYLYCDEIHQEMAMAYSSQSICEIHEGLMKGDKVCHFMVAGFPDHVDENITKAHYERLEKKIQSDPLKWTITFLRREAYMVSMLYYFLAEAIIEEFGSKGKDIVASAVKEIGNKCGEEINKTLKESNLEPTWENIFDNFYLPYKYAWKLDKVKNDNENYVVEINDCPIAKIWKEAGNNEIGPIYCENLYNSLFLKIDPAIQVNISTCMGKGDTKCRLELERRTT